jgi:ribosomal protein L11 methyltransferase
MTEAEAEGDLKASAPTLHRFRLECEDETIREWLIAEAFEAGAEGAEERELEGRFEADIYAPLAQISSVRAGLEALGAPGTRIGPSETLAAVDWSEAWKDGLEAFEVSPRLLVRPPFVETRPRAGQSEIVIEPGQAFGTGNHASTRLCLAWIDALLLEGAELAGCDRVLDVGTGSGVLALAAVALGAQQALGFDLDPVAVEAARAAAAENGWTGRTRFIESGIDALNDDDARYALVLANLLKREVLPIAAQIAARVAPTGRLVLAGLLAEDREEVLAAFAAQGLVPCGEREQQDAIGLWISPCLRRSETSMAEDA